MIAIVCGIISSSNNSDSITQYISTILRFALGSKISYTEAIKNNTLVSGNAGDEKNLHPGGRKNRFMYQFN